MVQQPQEPQTDKPTQTEQLFMMQQIIADGGARLMLQQLL